LTIRTILIGNMLNPSYNSFKDTTYTIQHTIFVQNRRKKKMSKMSIFFKNQFLSNYCLTKSTII